MLATLGPATHNDSMTFPHARRVRAAHVVVALLAASTVGCTADESAVHDSALQVPSDAAMSETEIVTDSGVLEVSLDNGSEVVAWIDPSDIRKVWAQHSDPDADDLAADDAWTAPRLVHTAGDGCLLLDGDTDGETVALIAYCYEKDAFIEQAPDEALAAVSTDGVAWETKTYLELTDTPVVDDGTVTWGDDLTWSSADGFEE